MYNVQTVYIHYKPTVYCAEKLGANLTHLISILTVPPFFLPSFWHPPPSAILPVIPAIPLPSSSRPFQPSFQPSFQPP